MSILSEESEWEGRRLVVSWQDGEVLPPRELVRQASGFCFTADGRLVIVGDGTGWSLPGGHPESGESIEQALKREIREEACAIVEALAYIGAQRIDDPQAPDGITRYYQTRFWARVHLEAFEPQFETTQRRLVRPEELFQILGWKRIRVAQRLLDTACAQERSFQKSRA